MPVPAVTPAPVLLAEWPAHSAPVHGLSVSTDGARVASAGDDGVVRIWNIADGTLAATLAGHEG